MNIFNKCLGLILFATFSVTAMADGTKQKVTIIKFKAAHGPYQLVSKPLYAFKTEVEKATHGALKIDVILPMSLAESSPELVQKTYEQVQSGEVQMSQMYTSLLANQNPDLFALDLPYIFRDHEHAFSVVDGEIGKSLFAKLEANSNLKGLGYTYCGGYRLIGTKSKTINSMIDFTGLKIINNGGPVSGAILKELGAESLGNVKKTDIAKLIKNKTADGELAVYPRYFHTGEYKKMPIANEVFLNIQFTGIVINKNFFRSLTSEQQNIIQAAANKISLMERNLAIKIAEDISLSADKYGIQVVKLNASEKEKIISKLSSVDWSKKFGISPQVIQQIIETKKSSMAATAPNQ